MPNEGLTFRIACELRLLRNVCLFADGPGKDSKRSILLAIFGVKDYIDLIDFKVDWEQYFEEARPLYI